MIRRYQTMRKAILSLVAAILSLGAHASSSSAGEICVICSAPEQTYLCSVVGADASTDQRRLGFYCVARIAEDEGHGSCAAVRNQQQCRGLRRSYTFDASAPAPGPLADDHRNQAEPAAGTVEHEGGPPETVVELTRETARRTGESLDKAAERTVETTRGIGERVRDAAQNAAGAVENATRTTIRCIGSLFNDC